MKKSVVAVTGPLEPFADGYRDVLIQRGYVSTTVVSYLFSFARVSRWLAEQGLASVDLDPARIDRFLADIEDRRRHRVDRTVPRGMTSMLAYLRDVDVVPTVVVRDSTPSVELLDRFAEYLSSERGLAANTILGYRRFAGAFLTDCLPGSGDPAALTAKDVHGFVLEQAQQRGAGSLNNVVTALRSLLRFLYVQAYTPSSLASAAPWAVARSGRGSTRLLSSTDVDRLLGSCDRRTSTGRRDYAIVTVLARLGLRANEMACLAVDDIDWRAGVVTVHGKGNRVERLPLPSDVGAAIAAYCRRGRPRNGCRAVFLNSHAPHGPLCSSAVSHVVVRACGRAGLPPAYSHRLRHSTAAALRRAGAPLLEIAQILRHAHPVTTAGYAHEDVAALASIARRWPGGAA